MKFRQARPMALLFLFLSFSGCGVPEQEPPQELSDRDQSVVESEESIDGMERQRQAIAALQEKEAAEIEAEAEARRREYENKTLVEKTFFEHGQTVFEGTLGDRPFRMLIYKEGDNLTAYCLFKYTNDEILLSGQVEGPSDLRLEESEKAGEGGIYRLSVIEEGRTLAGQYENGVDSTSLPVTMTLRHGFPNTSSADIVYDTLMKAEAEEFAEQIQRCLLQDNREGLAELINYPIDVPLEGEGWATVKSTDDFVQLYDQIIDDSFRREMGTAYTKYMFRNYKGVLMDGGEYYIWYARIWIEGGEPEIKITAILS